MNFTLDTLRGCMTINNMKGLYQFNRDVDDNDLAKINDVSIDFFVDGHEDVRMVNNILKAMPNLKTVKFTVYGNADECERPLRTMMSNEQIKTFYGVLTSSNSVIGTHMSVIEKCHKDSVVQNHFRTFTQDFLEDTFIQLWVYDSFHCPLSINFEENIQRAFEGRFLREFTTQYVGLFDKC